LGGRELVFAVVVVVLATVSFVILSIGSGGDYYVMQVVNSTVPGSIRESASISSALQPVSMSILAFLIIAIVVALGILLYRLVKSSTTLFGSEVS
jgi:preprotein translocase subunit SecG